jgi:hypothetical protein
MLCLLRLFSISERLIIEYETVNEMNISTGNHYKKTKTPWSESASELYRPSDRRLSSKRLPTFADRVCHMVSVTDPYGRILGL